MSTAILCRYDNVNTKPVVFLADSIDYDKQTIKAWLDGKTVDASLMYYHTTVPLSQADNKALMQQFMNATHDPDVVLRDRLPRKSKVIKDILAPAAPLNAPEQARMRSKRDVPNRITAQPVGASNGFQFDVKAAIEATRIEFNDKLDALVRAMQKSPSQATSKN